MYDMYYWDESDPAPLTGAERGGQWPPGRPPREPGRPGRPRRPFRWRWTGATTEGTPAPRATSKVRRMGTSAVKLAVIGGDGIGPEVVAEALKVLQRGRGRP